MTCAGQQQICWIRYDMWRAELLLIDTKDKTGRKVVDLLSCADTREMEGELMVLTRWCGQKSW